MPPDVMIANPKYASFANILEMLPIFKQIKNPNMIMLFKTIFIKKKPLHVHCECHMINNMMYIYCLLYTSDAADE